jgi:hypothetical protein
MHVILGNWEAEIQRITVPSHPGQKSSPDPISMEKKRWTWWHMSIIPGRAGNLKKEDLWPD